MPYRPRELVIRAREAAVFLLAALDRDEMVQRFLDIYAGENRRPGRADQPTHYREQLQTIRRESILAMTLRIEAALPTRLKVHVSVRDTRRRLVKKGKKSKKDTKRKKPRTSGLDLAIPLLDLFREEFFVALGQSLEWTQEDAQQFWRDYSLYEKLSGKGYQTSARNRARGSVSGPFVDRTAMLLDPSLMEQARRAAGKFQLDLNAAADRVLRKVFSRRRAN